MNGYAFDILLMYPLFLNNYHLFLVFCSLEMDVDLLFVVLKVSVLFFVLADQYNR